jgi:hypothetical protein
MRSHSLTYEERTTIDLKDLTSGDRASRFRLQFAGHAILLKGEAGIGLTKFAERSDDHERR